ncbi:ABC transporter, nucleotide binding/ATPase protein [Ketogulonicigenium robustum]|uniref:ABC transporter, nucleotide binding/ATPase protein n=1 Tax=Ketogulonicigenium robustum TaxID=92947 RepID=A0A1W6NWD1_9RHOB|nr:ABC transporter, nucleotide binding/ATPase protein [Ketogulonicigenium robustum]
MLPTVSGLLWIAQAACIAMAIGGIAAGDFSRLAPLAAGVFAVGALRAFLDSWGTRLSFAAARRRLHQLRANAISALTAQSPLDRGRQESGAAASIIAEQAEAIVPYLARFRPIRLKAAVVPLVFFFTILPLSWAAALALLICLPVIPVFMALIGWRAEATSRTQMVELGTMNAFLLDRLRGLATIRGLGAVEATAQRIHTHAEQLREKTMAVLRIAFMTSAVMELFSALGVAMVAVYVGFHLLGELPFGAWGGQLTLTQGMFILLLAPNFFEPWREMSAVWHDRAAGEAAMKALAMQTDAQGQPLPTGPVSALGAAPAIAIDGLAFSHDGAPAPVFHDLNLQIAAGEHVAILAPSGGGKSTLLALIAGLASPTAGRISIGDATPAGARASIAWVGQNAHMFAGSLQQNITLGRPMAQCTVDAALKQAQLGRVAALHGHGAIGEDGVGLSGGEVLRLSLARALAREDTHPAQIILADEPTAHLDPITAADVTDSLIKAAQGKTLVVATHDPLLAQRMGRTIRLAPPRLEDAA